MSEEGVDFHKLITTQVKVLSFIRKVRTSHIFSVRMVFLS